jgi:phenylacetate-CoA ligase
MIGFLTRHLIIPGYEAGFQRRKSLHYWRELERSQWKSRDELRGIQFTALKSLLTHAFRSSTYYKELWTQLGLHPAELRGLDDLEKWPLLERDAIRQNLPLLRCDRPGEQLITKATGGSSGVPLQFYLNSDSDDRRMAAWHRGYSWAGAGPGTRQVYLWGVPLGKRTRRQQWKDHIYQRWIYRRDVLNTFELSEETMPRYLERYNRARPDVLVAYTNPLDAFARWLEERGARPFAPKSIVVGAEKLHAFQRERIERVFGAPVFETYGSREFMLIGGECERHDGLHLTAEHLIVEILDDEGRPVADCDQGNVVVTDLFNYGLPFVRYVTGDRAVGGFANCACGRGLPLLRKVVGRQLDVLTTPSGRQIPGEFFPHLVKDFADVRRFQVVQTSLDEIVLKMVVGTCWSRDSRSQLERLVRAQLGDDVRFTVEEVADIPLTAAGKLRVVVNQLSSPTAPVVAAVD